MDTKHKNKHKTNRKKFHIILITTSIVVVVVGYFYLQNQHDNEGVYPDDNVSYSPPTKEEMNVGNKTKEEIANNETLSNSRSSDQQPASNNPVNPVISAWLQDEAGNIRINGFVQGVIERDGTCEYTLTKDDKKVVESRNGMINAQDTTCGQIVIDRSKLSAGHWQATLHYISQTSEGISNETIIEVE